MEPSEMWGSGNYAAVADKIATAGETIVERAGIEPGMEVLDVACGTGNATIPAAKVGARVTGVDFAPALLEVARERGADAMVEVEWVEGDAQDLPFEDDSFERVISIFGHMFAADHVRTADELKRVCQPGGRVAIACWTPEGKIGAMFRTIGAIMPPPPEGFQPPVLWGTEEHVRELLGEEVEFSRHHVEWVESSVESYAEFMENSFGPLLNARETLGDETVHDAYLAYLHEANEADDGTLRFQGEYLVSVVPVR
jgi:ubiquinone/menaquinone biosynthesis C-methylase UbiE